jgi:predicted nucleotidyltransferase
MRQVTDEVIQGMVEALVRAADPERIVLFGSHGRGGADAESDVDLLVIEPEAFGPHRSRREELARLYRVLRGMGVAKDILLYRAEELDYWRDSINRVIADALREGRVVYERSQARRTGPRQGGE